MRHHATSTSSSTSPGKERILRARSLPSARPFRLAVFVTSIHYLGMLVSVTALISVFLEPSQTAVQLLVGGMIFSAISWLVAFFKRRSAFCPLCKGTPLINSGARVHSRAWCLYPLNHGVTATFSIMATQRFRCMYCGSDYDLLKPPTRLLHGTQEYGDFDETAVHDAR